MADVTKGWHAVFDKGSKQAQERLKKAHGHKPEFQAFLKSRGAEGGERSVKQATTSLTKATGAKVAAQKIADMRYKKALQASSDRVREMGRRRREGGEGLGGGLETARDVVAHVKKYGSIKAGRLGEETAIEEVEMNEVTKKEADDILGGPTTKKPKGPAGKLPLGYRLARSAARKAMKGAVGAVHKSMEKTMAKEEIEQVVEQDDTMEKKEMAQTQLHFIKYAAEEILEFIDMGGEIEEWYQNKLSKVQSEVESLHSYIEGEKRRTGMVKEEVEELNEGPSHLQYSGTVDGEEFTLTVPRHRDLGDHLDDKNAHSKVKRENPHLKPHHIDKIINDHEDVEIDQEPRHLYKEEVEQVDEKAPPGAKYERMVKHIKKGYAKGGLTPKEKSIAYATAWKAYGKKEEVEQVEEGAKDWKKAFSNVAQKNLQKDIGAMRAKVSRSNYIGMQPKVDTTKRVTAAVTKKGAYSEEVVTEGEGKVAVTPKEKALAAHHGDPKKITYGDVIKARLKSVAAKKMGK